MRVAAMAKIYLDEDSEKTIELVELFQVVGAGRGVGREIAIQLSHLGVFVACVDTDSQLCRCTVRRCAPGTAKAFVCDASDRKEVWVFFVSPAPIGTK